MAANLDPDITAPGCSIDVTFATKWWMTETIPMGMIVCLLFLFFSIEVYNWCFASFGCCRSLNNKIKKGKGKNKNAETTTPAPQGIQTYALIGGCVSIMYYLYMVR